ncbi:ATP-binding protein [Kordiimonas lacus]|uniref:histidine kinase n=1 Tax=Kordiimonas lacus TaxID=637679 RepID=A0A1G6ZWV3_9PROT|nr:ATP-binding protein [Kordiimonas lacus]SDE07148.1 CHASE4 domain-containing protein [Kordiimonas lacus]
MDVRRFVRPIFIAMFLCMVGYFALAGFLAYQQDKTSIAAERQKIQSIMQQYLRRLELLAEDNAWWDAAVQNVVQDYDERWVKESIADTTYTYSFVVGVLVMRPDGTAIYSRVTEGLPGAPALLDAGLADAIRSMKLPGIDEPESVSGYMVVDGRLFAYGASMVTTALGLESAVTPAFFDEPRPSLVFVSEITPAIISEMEREYSLAGIVFQTIPPDGQEYISLEAVSGGAPAGYLSWDVTRAGRDMLMTLVWPTLLMLVIIAFFIRSFLKRVRVVVEKVEAADKAKSDFLASTSHEIRTPLNAILGFSEMLQMEIFGKIEGEKNKQYIQLIRDSGTHLLSVINDILDMSKLEAGHFDIHLEKLDIHELVESSCELVQSLAQEKHIAVTCEVPETPVYTDRRVARQVMLNVLSNAVKFSPEGSAVELSGKPNGRWYAVTVKDNGVGMTEEHLEKALELFGQVRGGVHTRHAGTGLGLPLVVRFMALIGGGFDIQSEKGVGTEITLTFPMQDPAANA